MSLLFTSLNVVYLNLCFKLLKLGSKKFWGRILLSRHKEQCDKLYDKVQDATLAFASSDKDQCEDNGGYWEDNECNFSKLDNRSDKEACEQNGGDWKNKSCDFKDNDEPAHSDKGFNDWEWDEEDA